MPFLIGKKVIKNKFSSLEKEIKTKLLAEGYIQNSPEFKVKLKKESEKNTKKQIEQLEKFIETI